MCACVYVCVCVRVYVCIYTHTHSLSHTHINTHSSKRFWDDAASQLFLLMKSEVAIKRAQGPFGVRTDWKNMSVDDMKSLQLQRLGIVLQRVAGCCSEL